MMKPAPGRSAPPRAWTRLFERLLRIPEQAGRGQATHGRRPLRLPGPPHRAWPRRDDRWAPDEHRPAGRAPGEPDFRPPRHRGRGRRLGAGPRALGDTPGLRMGVPVTGLLALVVLIAGAAPVLGAEAPAATPSAPGESFRDCPVCPLMVVIPPGSFRMGSPADEAGRDAAEGPVHEVTIARPFALGRYEITVAEWDACVAERGCSARPGEALRQSGDHPMLNLAWREARAYVRWLSGKTGARYRLPSEAE